jgi:hypothetical protein
LYLYPSEYTSFIVSSIFDSHFYQSLIFSIEEDSNYQEIIHGKFHQLLQTHQKKNTKGNRDRNIKSCGSRPHRQKWC